MSNVTYVLRNDKSGTLKLEYLPIGWDNLKRTLTRSKALHSVAHAYTQELEFIRDGADYLTNAYERKGINAEVFLDIYKMDGQDMSNKLWFQSRVDFTTYERSYHGRVKVATEQVSFTQKLLSAEKVKVDLTSLQPLEGLATLGALPYKAISLHSKTIVRESHVKHREGEDTSITGYFTANNDSGTANYYYLASNGNIISSEVGQTYSNSSFVNKVSPVLDKKYIFQVIDGGPTSLQFDVDYSFSLQWDYMKLSGELVYEIYAVRESVAEPILFYRSPGVPFGGNNKDSGNTTLNVRASGTSSFELEAADEIYSFVRITYDYEVSGVFGDTFKDAKFIFDPVEVHKSELKCVARTITEGTTGQGIYFADALARTIESLTGEVGSFDSDYYSTTDGYHSKGIDTTPGRRLLANGIHLRGWELEEKPMTVTLADLLETAHALDAVGVEIRKTGDKWQAVAKPVKEFYRDDQVIDLGTVSKLYKKVDAERYYNEVRIGYEKYDIDSINSLDEFNGSREYKTCIAQQKAEYRAVAPFRADGYGIETARRQSREAAPNKSTPYDKDTFLICFKRIGSSIVSEKGDILQSSSNLIDPPTVYNVRISPARLFKRHEHLLSGCLQKEPDKEVRFTSGEVNVEMASQLMSETAIVKENASTPNEALAKPILLPETYEFEKKLTDEQISLLEAQPHSTILFNGGKAGYLQNVEIGFNGLAKFTLLKKYNG